MLGGLEVKRTNIQTRGCKYTHTHTHQVVSNLTWTSRSLTIATVCRCGRFLKHNPSGFCEYTCICTDMKLWKIIIINNMNCFLKI